MKMRGDDCLIRLRMVGAVNFYNWPASTTPRGKQREYRLIDLITGMMHTALTVGYDGTVTRVNKQMLINAIQTFGNTGARYQIVTEEVNNKYIIGEYEVMTVAEQHKFAIDEQLKRQCAREAQEKHNENAQ